MSETSVTSPEAKHDGKLKMAVLQRVCPGYRVPLFARLSQLDELDATLFIGEGIPNSKVKSAADLREVEHRKLKTRFIRLGSRVLPWHVGLVRELVDFDPDVILCEGESHFVGYLQAMWYRCFHKRNVALIHWCFISLPGDSFIGGRGYRSWIKSVFRKFFDAFLLYSSFSKGCLLRLGQPSEKMFVATNVGDTDRFVGLSNSTSESAASARRRLDLPDRFTVLYVGTLDANKRPDVMLDLAARCDSTKFSFVLLGAGPMLSELKERVEHDQLSNVFVRGRVVDDLPLYYRAANVMLIPGRGGIVISEAMAFGLPVVVHHADGTEYDLVQGGITGLRVTDGNLAAFQDAITTLQEDPGLCERMASESKELLATRFTTANMAEQIVNAAHFAAEARTSMCRKAA